MVELDRERLAGALRMKRGSQPTHKVAAEVAVSKSTLQRMERGQHEPTVRSFLRACLWLERNPTDFTVQKEIEPSICPW